MVSSAITTTVTSAPVQMHQYPKTVTSTDASCTVQTASDATQEDARCASALTLERRLRLEFARRSVRNSASSGLSWTMMVVQSASVDRKPSALPSAASCSAHRLATILSKLEEILLVKWRRILFRVTLLMLGVVNSVGVMVILEHFRPHLLKPALTSHAACTSL